MTHTYEPLLVPSLGMTRLLSRYVVNLSMNRNVFCIVFFFSAMHDFMKGRSDATSADLTSVVDTDIHALIGCFPRSRYPIGLECCALFLINSLPEFIGDAIGRLMTPKHPIAAINKLN